MRTLSRVADVLSVDAMSEEDAQGLGEEIGIVWEDVEFTPADLLEGMQVELEHGAQGAGTDVTGDDPLATAKIAVVHLQENAKYYKLLKQFVENAE